MESRRCKANGVRSIWCVSVPLRGLSSWKECPPLVTMNKPTHFSPLAGIKFVESESAAIADRKRTRYFSPLAGIKFVESQLLLDLSKTLCDISVPLRGLSSWKVLNCSDSFRDGKNFSPLAGIKFVERHERCLSWHQSVNISVPLRGLSSWKACGTVGRGAVIDFSPLAGIKFVESIYFLSK